MYYTPRSRCKKVCRICLVYQVIIIFLFFAPQILLLAQSVDGTLVAEVDQAEWRADYGAAISLLDEAVRGYERQVLGAVSMSPGYAKAEAYYREAQDPRDLDLAYAAYKLSVNNVPLDDYRLYALFRLGDIQKRRADLAVGNTKAREDLYEKAVRDYQNALRQYAMAARSMTDEASLLRSPEIARAEFAAYWVGDYYYSRGHIDKALEAFEDLRKLFPQGHLELADNARYRVASCLQDQGKWDQAQDQLRQLVEEGPDAPLAQAALLELGDSYFSPGASNIHQREQLYREFIWSTWSDADTKIEAAEKLMLIYTDLRDIAKARAVKQKVDTFLVDADPKCKLSFHIAYAQCLCSCGATDEAYPILRSSANTSDRQSVFEALPYWKKARYWRLLARIAYDERDYSVSAGAYEILRSLVPISEDESLRLARAYLQTDNVDKAILFVEEWLTHRSQHKENYFAGKLLLAEAYRQKRNYTLAIEHLGQVVDGAGDPVYEGHALISIGNVYFEQRDYVRFAEVCTQLETDYSNTLDADLLASIQHLVKLLPGGRNQ